MPVRTRLELATHLEEVMSHAYAELEERQRLDADTSLLKTYLVEAHANPGTHQAVLDLLRHAFGQETLGEGADSNVSETEEQFFFQVDAVWRQERATYYVDATEHRYWVVHSTSKSTPSDRILRRLISNNDKLDTVWLPAQMLEALIPLGSLRGLGLDYDRREIPDVDFDAADAPVEFLKMQLWGNRASDILRVLRQQDAFPQSTTLSKVKIKHWLDKAANEESFSIGDVKFDGKITARGTSFRSHVGLVTTLSRRYAERINGFEENFRMSHEVANGRVSLHGEPLSIVFSRPIGNLETFVESVFSGNAPFRLWGTPSKVGEGYYRVAAIDLHVSQQLFVEITSEFMRLYMPSGTCGNTVTRLYTNLQHYYDSLVKMLAGNGETIF